MKLVKDIGCLLFCLPCAFFSCNLTKGNYPELIREHELEAIYDQAIIDWHILNSTGAFSEAKYLFREDPLIPSPDWISSVDSMRKYYPGEIFDFLEVELVLFQPEQYCKLEGDTIIFSFSPEIIENDYLIDPVDRIYHTLYYVDGKLIQENEGRFLIEIPDSAIRPYGADLIHLVQSTPKNKVHRQLRRRIHQITNRRKH